MFDCLIGTLAVKVEETGKTVEVAKSNNSSGFCGSENCELSSNKSIQIKIIK